MADAAPNAAAPNATPDAMQRCLAARDRQPLAEEIERRGADEQKAQCERGLYINATDDMVLLPDQRWSVPMRREPVCRFPANDYQPMLEQSSLAGSSLAGTSLAVVANNTKVGDVVGDGFSCSTDTSGKLTGSCTWRGTY